VLFIVGPESVTGRVSRALCAAEPERGSKGRKLWHTPATCNQCAA